MRRLDLDDGALRRVFDDDTIAEFAAVNGRVWLGAIDLFDDSALESKRCLLQRAHHGPASLVSHFFRDLFDEPRQLDLTRH